MSTNQNADYKTTFGKNISMEQNTKAINKDGNLGYL